MAPAKRRPTDPSDPRDLGNVSEPDAKRPARGSGGSGGSGGSLASIVSNASEGAPSFRSSPTLSQRGVGSALAPRDTPGPLEQLSGEFGTDYYDTVGNGPTIPEVPPQLSGMTFARITQTSRGPNEGSAQVTVRDREGNFSRVRTVSSGFFREPLGSPTGDGHQFGTTLRPPPFQGTGGITRIEQSGSPGQDQTPSPRHHHHRNQSNHLAATNGNANDQDENSDVDGDNEQMDSPAPSIDAPHTVLDRFRVQRPRLLLIYTGGTIGMKQGSDGSLAPVPGYLTRCLTTMSIFRGKGMPDFDIVEWNEIMDSSDFGPNEWIALGNQIKDVYLDYDGFVVLHGTDTMAYTACALSFMLENLGKPVIITGSMVPFAHAYTDARDNIIASMLFAAQFEIPEVCIFFGTHLMRGNRAQKSDTESLDAFQSLNYPALARLGVHMNINMNRILQPPKKRLRLHTALCSDVIVCRMTPGFSDTILHNILKPPTKGVVLQLYGVGNAPHRREGLLQAIEHAIKVDDVVVVVTSQCTRGYVNLFQYENGVKLADVGCVSGMDMTPEAAAIKLSLLLGQGVPTDQVKRLMTINMRGELTPDRKDWGNTGK
eukprot:Clim_evm51s201 gene=Clim_evmTU51s201